MSPQLCLPATSGSYQLGSVIALWRHNHSSLHAELLTVPSVLFPTQKHSPHCSFEEEHHQIHPADVPWPSYCHPLHSHADWELWERRDNAGRPAQRPQKGLLLRSVSQSVHYSTSHFRFVLLLSLKITVLIVQSRYLYFYDSPYFQGRMTKSSATLRASCCTSALWSHRIQWGLNVLTLHWWTSW